MKLHGFEREKCRKILKRKLNEKKLAPNVELLVIYKWMKWVLSTHV